MFDTLFSPNSGKSSQQSQTALVPSQSAGNNNSTMFGNLFSSNSAQTNPFGNQNKVLDAQANPPQKQQSPAAKPQPAQGINFGNLFNDAVHGVENLFAPPVKIAPIQLPSGTKLNIVPPSNNTQPGATGTPLQTTPGNSLSLGNSAQGQKPISSKQQVPIQAPPQEPANFAKVIPPNPVETFVNSLADYAIGVGTQLTDDTKTTIGLTLKQLQGKTLTQDEQDAQQAAAENLAGIFMAGGAEGAPDVNIGDVSSQIGQKLTKDVTETAGKTDSYFISSQDLLSLGNKTSNDIIDKLNLSTEELKTLRKSALNGQGINIQIPSPTILEFTDKPYWAQIKSMFGKEPSSASSITVTAKPNIQNVSGLLGDGEHTPQEVMNAVINNDLAKTPEGQQTLKAALDAQKQGMNITVQGSMSNIAPAEGKAATLNGINTNVSLTSNPVESPQSTKVQGGTTIDKTNTIESPQVTVRVPSEFKSPAEQAAFTKITQDPTAVKQEYISKFGNEVNPDLALKLFPEYKGYNSGDLSRASGAVKDLVYNDLLKTAQGTKNNTVVVNAGGSGSGKTSGINSDAQLKENNSIVLDTTFSHNSAIKDIKRALDNNFRVHVNYVYREPSQAWGNGVLPRLMKEGRVISEGYFLRSHVDAQRNILDAYKKYKDNSNVGFTVFENTPAGRHQIDIDKLANVTYDKKALADYIKTATDKAYEQGQITKEEYSATTSDRGELEKYSAQLERSSQSKQETKAPGAETVEATNAIRDALYTGDTQAAQSLHEVFSQELKDLPSFDSLQKEINQIYEQNVTELKTIQKELIDSGISNNPDDPTNQLLQIARQLSDHFSRPDAKFKITGTERTYKSADGQSMIVGGNASEAFDRLVNATDIEGFKKNVKILDEKFDGVFTRMYDNIRSGSIDGGDYEQFKKYYESIQGKRFSASNGKNIQNASAKTVEQSVQTPANRSSVLSSSNSESKTAESSQGSGAVNSASQITQSGKTIDNESTNTQNGGREVNLNRGNDTGESFTHSSESTRTGGDEGIGEPENYINPQGGAINIDTPIGIGLKEFFKEDVIPKVQVLGDAGAETYSIVNPQKANEQAQAAANIIRRAKSTIDNFRTVTQNKYGKFEGFFNRYSDAQGLKNISAYERTGKFAVEPKGIDYSTLHKESLAASYEARQAFYGNNTPARIENYVRHAFEFPSEDTAAQAVTALTNFSRSLSGSKADLMRRTIDLPMDEALAYLTEQGIKAKFKSTNPETLRQWSLINAKKDIVFGQAWKESKAAGLIKYAASNTPPKGLIPLNDRAAQVFAPSEVHYGAEGAVSDKGYQKAIPMGRYYAEPAVARIFNNAISQGLEGNKMFRVIRGLTNTMNQFQLALPGFHSMGTTINAGVNDVALGLRNQLQLKPIEGTTRIIRGLVPGASIARYYFMGRNLMNNLKADDPKAYELLNKYVNPAGHRLGQDQHYTNLAMKNMTRAWKNGNLIGAGIRLPQAVIEGISHPLFGSIIPKVKTGAFLDLAANVYNRLPKDATPEQISSAMGNVSMMIDGRFGQVAYDNYFWNKALKDISMVAVRSVGWDVGTFQQIGGGILVDPIKSGLLGKGRVNGKFNERVTDRSLYVLSLFLVAGIAGAIYQYLHTGTFPDKPKDYYAPWNGLLDSAGNKVRVVLPTYLKDIYSYSQNPFTATVHKSSPLIDLISSIISGKDYYNNLIMNPNDPMGVQAAQFGQYLLSQMYPFAVTSAIQQHKSGANPEQQAESFFGINKAPASLIQSAKQKAASAAYDNIHGMPSSQTPEQVAKQNLETQARQEIKKSGWKNSPAFQQLMQNGTLKTQVQRKNFIKSASQTSVQRLTSHLPKAVRAQINSMQ